MPQLRPDIPRLGLCRFESHELKLLYIFYNAYIYIYIHHIYIYIPEKGGTKASLQTNAQAAFFSLRFMLCVLHLRAVHHRDQFFAAGRFTAATNPVVAAWRITPERLHGESSKPCCFKVVGDSFTQRRFYTQKVLHTDTQTLLHTNIFTQRRCNTQTLLHTDFFTHKHLYTEMLLHTDPFTQRHFYTQTLLHTDPGTHTHVFHTDPFTHRRFYTQTLLHTDPFTHKHI